LWSRYSSGEVCLGGHCCRRDGACRSHVRVLSPADPPLRRTCMKRRPRGRARSATGGQLTHSRRGAGHEGQHCQAAEAVARKLKKKAPPRGLHWGAVRVSGRAFDHGGTAITQGRLINLDAVDLVPSKSEKVPVIRLKFTRTRMPSIWRGANPLLRQRINAVLSQP
jgi:hypothetical protein